MVVLALRYHLIYQWCRTLMKVQTRYLKPVLLGSNSHNYSDRFSLITLIIKVVKSYNNRHREVDPFDSCLRIRALQCALNTKALAGINLGTFRRWKQTYVMFHIVQDHGIQ